MLVQGLVSGMARNDPAGATDYVIQMDAERAAQAEGGDNPGDDRWRNFAVDRQVESIANVLMMRGIDEATSWAETLPEGAVKSSAFDRVAEDYAQQDPVAAANWVSRHADQEWAGRAVREVAEEYARNDPSAAVEWAETLPEQHQGSALRESFERWTREDAVAAGEYLTGMSDGAARDAAVSSFAGALDREDPQTAASWAATIGDEGARNQTLEAVARSWMRTNKEEAQTWLPNSGLAPEVQERIVSDSERGGDRGGWGDRGRGGRRP